MPDSRIWKAPRYTVLTGLLVVVALGLTATTGCVSYSQMETAEALNEGESRSGGAVTFTRYQASGEFNNVLEDEQTEYTGSGTFPSFQMWHRQGMADGLEVRGAMWLTGFRIGGKYQLLGEYGRSGLDLSIGADFGYMRAGLGITHMYVPLYLGYRVNQQFAVYLNPKFIGINWSAAGENLFRSVPAGTIGVALGQYDESEFYIEGSGGYDRFLQEPILSASIGFGF